MTDTLYYQLEMAMQNSGSTVYPSETQGALCGMLCFASQLDVSSWMAFILDQTQNDTQASYRRNLDENLAEVQEITESGFNPSSGGMELLLPDDEAELQERLEALSSWCEGFLYGIGVSGIKDTTKLAESAQEFISDIREISRLDTESEDEDAEHYYMELVEYIRVGVLVFREEVLPSVTISPSSSDSTTTQH